MAQYQPGQRWISDSEAELGLGTILAQDGRLLTVLYPATGDTRQYALRNAPLTRVRFAPGDEVTHFEGWKMTVREVEESEGLLVYHGLTAQNEQCTLPETQLSNFIQFRLASDRLFAGQIDPLPWFSLRYHTLERRSQLLQSSLWGLGGARAQPIAHQLHIAREVADRMAPRVLLADEVGLGKTIEAGLIIHRQLLSGRAGRVLILVPENLQHQWLVEMRRRFNLQVALFDKERFAESDASNPFEDTQLALVALEWLKEDERAQDALFAAGWDLLVVDEAHHLVWHQDQVSAEYALVEQLAEIIPGVLLLTATPEQLGQDSHFARLRLLDPNRFHDLEAFRRESEQYRPVAEAVQELLDHGSLSAGARKAIHGFLGSEGDELLASVEGGDEEARSRLVRELLDRHGTGRVLFRNTRAAVQGFPQRELHAYPLPMPSQYEELPAGEHPDLYPEVNFQQQWEDGDDNNRWWRFDPRVEWLIDTLKMLKQFKVLVICAHAETALDLEDALRLRSGISATVFHEGMSILERDRAAAYFADEEFGAQVLICSEIGSEGRNFQFAHHLVLFDLPAHPDLLEQRIGRLDRIGQRHTIQLHVPHLENSAQQRLFQWYHQALNAFLNTCPTGNALQHEFGPRLLPLLEQKKHGAWRRRVERAVTASREEARRQAEEPADPINPQRVFRSLSEQLPDDAILCGDSGSHTNWYARDIRMRPGMLGSLSGKLATMGSGVPYAIAAKLAYPQRPVVAMVGDGAMQMNGNAELVTVQQYWQRWDSPTFIVLVLNNGDLNQVTWEQRALAGDPEFSPAQEVIDFPYARYADMLGFKGIRVDRPEDIDAAWAEAFAADRPVLLEVVTDPNVPPLPPHISFEQAKHLLGAMLQDDPKRWGVIRQSARQVLARR